MTLNRAWIPSPNFTAGYSSRRLIVLHTSEGAQTYQSLGNFFAESSSQVSSHVGIDDVRGTIGEYVKRSNTAWTAANANPVAVQAEFCTPSGAAANWTASIWKNQHPNMLLNAGDWIAEEAAYWNIPIVSLTPSQAQGSGRGVCQHSDLGAWGGGHYDCGNGFPMDYVIDLAKGGKPSPSPPTEILDMNYLEFDGAKNACAIVIPKEYADGKHRIVFGCRTDATIRIDPGNAGSTETRNLGYGQGGQTWLVPSGCRFAVVTLDKNGNSPIAMSYTT